MLNENITDTSPTGVSPASTSTSASTSTDTDVAESPDAAEVGAARTAPTPWVLPLNDDVGGPVIEFSGRFIGFGTSQRTEHLGHPDTTHLAKVPGERSAPCAACRWFETRLFRVHGHNANGQYLLFNTGESVVPGEQPLYTAHWARSPYEIIDLLTTIRTNEVTGERKTFLRVPARRLLAQAAYYDTEMRDAYEGRMEQL